MVRVVQNLESLIDQVSNYVLQVPEEKMSEKQHSEKWSKKEVLGHLVDSAIYNLQRFTEIQFKDKPFKLKSYDQNELVKVNNYQDSDTNDLLNLLRAINKRIINIIESLTEKMLNYEIVTEQNVSFNLEFLVKDYVDHFEHHTKQIVE